MISDGSGSRVFPFMPPLYQATSSCATWIIEIAGERVGLQKSYSCAEFTSPDTSKVLENEMEVGVENAPVFALP